MAIKMVREPSETPNINNIDDIVPMRYAYGNQNGYVISKGNEISNTVNGLNFSINSGRLVLQGVECDIDASGVTIAIDNIATKRYYTIYLEVNLGLNTATIKDEYDTATYPTIDAGDDLTENNTGVARLPLYRFIAQNGIISEVDKVVESIKYTKDVKVENSTNSNKVNNLEITQDENGVLKVGDIIIPQKKLIWEGDLPNDELIGYASIEFADGVINNGDKILVETDSYDRWLIIIDYSGRSYSTYAGTDSFDNIDTFSIFSTRIDIVPNSITGGYTLKLYSKTMLRMDILSTSIIDASKITFYNNVPITIKRVYKVIE